jgi:cytochrome c553
MKSPFLVALFLLCLASAAWADSGQPLSQLKAQQVCSACHGKDGNSASDQFPRLAGQREAYIASALRAYRAGLRNDPTMRAQAEHLSNQEIADLAAYFGAQTGLTTRRPNWSCDG